MPSLWDDIQFFLHQIRWHEPEVVAHFQQTMKMIPSEYLVALMPRCASCSWWHGPQKDKKGREECTEPSISPEQVDEFMTLPDFGCVKWKEKS